MVGAVTTSAARALMLLLVAGLLAASPAPAAAQTAGPDRLRLSFPQYDGGLTPYTFELGYPLMTLVYDTLMWRDQRGVPQPWLARSVQRSRGGRRVTVALRPEARWHDGRQVTAQDVAFTLDYLRERPQPRFTPQLADVQRVVVVDRLTVAIDLRRPSLGFEDQPLSDVPILPRHLWAGLPASRRAPAGLAVGSGPYRLVSARRKEGYVLRANERYFRGAPRVDELRVPIIGDLERTFDALRARDLDMVPLSLGMRDAVRLDSTLGIAVQRGPSYVGTMLLLNLRRPPFDDAAARRAVAQALELPRIVRNVAPAEAAIDGFVHPASRWSPDRPVQRADVPAARRALSDLRLPQIRILAPEHDPVRAEAGRQVVLALRRAGAGATLVELPSAQLSRAIGETGSSPDFEAAITSITPLVSHDPDYLRAMFGSDARSAPLNLSGYRSAAFDEAAGRVASAATRTARGQAIRAELQLVARDVPSIPLFFSEGAYAYRSEIYGGWRFIRGTGIFDKRSLLPGPVATASTSAPEESAAEVGEEADSGGGLSILNIVSLVLLGGIVLLAIYALLQRRST